MVAPFDDRGPHLTNLLIRAASPRLVSQITMQILRTAKLEPKTLCHWYLEAACGSPFSGSTLRATLRRARKPKE
jgi:hypothetical protein